MPRSTTAPDQPTTWQAERARIGGMSNRAKTRAIDDAELLEARGRLRALKLEEYVLKALAGHPPLSQDQRDRIADLLRAGGGVRRD